MAAIGMGLTGTTAFGAETPTQTLVLHNADAEQKIDCPDAHGDYWHFVLAPNKGFAIHDITLNLAGDLVAFGPGDILTNNGQLDNVFVEVPTGYALGDLSNEGTSAPGDESTARVSPATGRVKFVLSHLCDGDGQYGDDEESEDSDEYSDEESEESDEYSDEESEESEESDEYSDEESEESDEESTTTSTSTSTSTTSTTTSTTSTTTSTTTTTTLPCPFGPVSQGKCVPQVTVTAICYEVPVTDSALTFWYEITNLEDVEVTVDFAGSSAVLAPLGSTIVSTTVSPIVVTFQDKGTVATAEEPVEECVNDVTFEKVVEGPSVEGTTYTIQISRLVGEGYVPEGEPFQLMAGEIVTIPLPSTFNPAGITYFIEEVDAGGAAAQAVTPDTFTVNGHKGETISVVITNSFAAISLDKQVSKTTDVQPGDALSYTLVATNVGAVTLDPVTIVDRLPAEVTYAGFSVVGDAGTCTLTEAAAPQLVTCELADALAPAASTAAITLNVTVNAGVAPGTQIVNQAMALGTYAKVQDLAQPELLAATALPTDLSCQPTAGQVCDLSAKVGSGVGQPVVTTSTTTTTTTTTTTAAPPATVVTTSSAAPTTLVGSSGATTTVVSGSAGAAPSTVASRLPSTGSDATSLITILGMGFVVVGMTLMLGSRRRVIG